MKRLAVFTICLLALASAGAGSSVKYQVQDLGPTLLRNSEAWAINNSGQVVGRSAHAYLWSKKTGTTDLGTLPGGFWSEAYGISGTGIVIGSGWSGEANAVRAFKWTAKTGMVALGPVSPDHVTLGLAVNDKGQVAGYAGDYGVNGPHDYAMFWDVDGKPVDVSAVCGGDRSYAYGINNSGQIAGSTIEGSAPLHLKAFRWSRDGSLVWLKPLEGQVDSVAHAINDKGQVAGWSQLGDSGRAVIWQPDGRVKELAALPGRDAGEGWGINSRGQVVGRAQPVGYEGFSSRRAVLWDVDGTAVDLGTLPGGRWSEAHAINDSGEIVGFSDDGKGFSRAVIWTPVKAAN